jgi:hypothetical protein
MVVDADGAVVVIIRQHVSSVEDTISPTLQSYGL